MAEPFVTWYATADVDLVALVAGLSEIGLTPQWPRRPSVVSVLDLEGDTVPTSLEAFDALLMSSTEGSVTFQLWFSDSEDVVLTIFRGEEMTGPLARLRVTIYLDGAPRSQADAVAAAMEDVAAGHPGETLALVTDLQGATEEFDWGQALAALSQAPLVDSLVVSTHLLANGAAEIGDAWLVDTPARGLASRRR